jgi:hypothetical protein
MTYLASMYQPTQQLGQGHAWQVGTELLAKQVLDLEKVTASSSGTHLGKYWLGVPRYQDATGLGLGQKTLPKPNPPHYAGQSGSGQRVNFLDQTQTRLTNNRAWVGAGLVWVG